MQKPQVLITAPLRLSQGGKRCGFSYEAQGKRARNARH